MAETPGASGQVVTGGGLEGLVEQRADFEVAPLVEEVEGEVIKARRPPRVVVRTGFDHLAKQGLGRGEFAQVLKGEGKGFRGVDAGGGRMSGQQLAGSLEVRTGFGGLAGLPLNHPQGMEAQAELDGRLGRGVLLLLGLPLPHQFLVLGLRRRQIERLPGRRMQGSGGQQRGGQEAEQGTHGGGALQDAVFY